MHNRPAISIKGFICLIFFYLGAMQCGCGSGNSTGGKVRGNLDIVPSERVGAVQLGMSLEDASKILGPPKKRDAKFAYFPDLGIETRLADGKIITIICYFKSKEYEPFSGQTDSGINAESSMEDVLAEYGRPTHEFSSILSEVYDFPGALQHDLIYDEEGVRFTFVNGAIYFIQVYRLKDMIESVEVDKFST